MQAHSIPGVHRNACWMCKYRDRPYALTCHGCRCEAMPTINNTRRDVPDIIVQSSHGSVSLLSEAPYGTIRRSCANLQKWKKCRDRRRVRFSTCHNDQRRGHSTLLRVPRSTANSRLDAFIEASRFILDTDLDKNNARVPLLQLQYQNDNYKHSTRRGASATSVRASQGRICRNSFPCNQ
jgi:hypothetical protein